MPRLLPLFILLLLAVACGEPAPTPSPEPAPAPEGEDDGGEPEASDGTGPFTLEVRPGGVPGRRPPVRITGDAGGVEATVRKAADPEALLALFDDPRAIPPDIALPDGLEEIARVAAKAGDWYFLPALPSGLYLVEARRGEHAMFALLPVSDLVLVTKRARDEILVYVADARGGENVPGTRVVISGADGRMAGDVDASGVFRSSCAVGEEAWVLATAGDRIGLATPAHYPAAAEGPVCWLMPDRPACRPGETLHFKGIHRVRESTGYRIPRNGEVRWRLRDPLGSVVAEGLAETSMPGSFHGEIEIPEETGLGRCRLEADVDGRTFGADVTIEEFVRPSFEVRIEPEARTVLAGSAVKAEVSAAYLPGGVIAGVPVDYLVTKEPIGAEEAEIVLEGRGALDGNGRLATVFEAATPGEYRISVEATDRAGATAVAGTTVRALASSLVLTVETESMHYEPGSSALVFVRATFPLGEPFPVEGTVRCAGSSVPFRIDEDDRSLWIGDLPLDGTGRVRIEALAADDRGGEVRGGAEVLIRGGPASDRDGEGILVLPDREEFIHGETAEVLVVLPHALEGAVLLETVEGTALGSHAVVRAEGGSHVFTVQLPSRLGTRVVFTATAVKGGKVYRGSAAVRVLPRNRLLDVRVRPQREVVKPGGWNAIVVGVSTEAGRHEAEVCVAVFDDALSTLYPAAAPRIEEFFYGLTRHDVSTDSSVSGFFLGRAPPSVFLGKRGGADPATGAVPPMEAGGKDGAEAPPERSEFAPLALWAPALDHPAEGGVCVAELTLPDDLTRWRVLAIAVASDTRVGTGTATFRTARPVSVRLGVPRFLVEEDVVALRAAARNEQAEGVEGNLAIRAEGLLMLEAGAAHVKLEGGGGEAAVTATAAARSAGTARVSGMLAAVEGDRVVREIPVLPRARTRDEYASGTLGPTRTSASLRLPSDARRSSVRLSIHISGGPAAAVVRALPTLVDYPHGCTEQTLSRFVPNLVALTALSELGIEPAPPVDRAESLARVGLARLLTLQHEDGGWGWWEEDRSEPGMTALALDGLLLAREAGVEVGDAPIERARGYLGSRLESGLAKTDPEAAAHAIRLLPEEHPALALLFDSKARQELSPTAAAHLAVALQRFEREEDASWLAARIVEDGQGRWGTDGAENGRDDPVESTAVVLRALLALDAPREITSRAADYLLDHRRGRAWKSTRDSAAAALALLEYAKVTGLPESEGVTVRVRVGDGIAASREIGREELLGNGATIEVPARFLAPGRNRIVFEAAGGEGLRYSARLTWLETPETFHAEENGIRITRESRQVREGGKLAKLPPSVRRGDLLLVTLKVAAREDRRYVMVDCPIPAGTESVRFGPPLEGVDPAPPQGVHVERHDERVLFFLPEIGTGDTTLHFLLRVTHSGRFRALPATASLMYFPRVRGTTGEDLLYVE